MKMVWGGLSLSSNTNLAVDEVIILLSVFLQISGEGDGGC